MVKFAIIVFVLALLAIVITSYFTTGSPTNYLESVYLQIQKTGRLQIASVPPEVIEIRVDGQTCTQTAFDCSWAGLQDGIRTTIPISVLILDNNGDCGINDELVVEVHLCDFNNFPCTDLGATRFATLTGTKTSNPGGMGDWYCLIESEIVDPPTNVFMEFWEYPTLNPPTDAWALFARVSDDGGPTGTWGSTTLEVKWALSTLNAARYPRWEEDTGDIYFGSLDPGVWSDGIEDTELPDFSPDPNPDQIKNSGNVPLEIYFRAEDFGDDPVTPTDFIEIESPNTPTPCTYDEPPADGICDYTFYVDDDNLRGDDAGNDILEGIPDEENENTELTCLDQWDPMGDAYCYAQFPPAPTELDVCDSFDCDTVPDDDDTYETIYYHLFIKPGAVGTYTNYIHIGHFG